MNARQTMFLIAAGIAAGVGVWLWRGYVRSETLRSSLPPRPALNTFPPGLAARVAAAELRIRRDAQVAALAELGQLYHANGFLPEAAQCYRGLLVLDPANARWRHRLACLHAGFGQLEAALALWEQVIRQAPDHLPAHIRRGDVLLKLNRVNDAAAAFQAALQREPRHPHALAGLARSDVMAGRWQEARARLEQAAEASAGRIGADLLTTVYEHLGDTGRARALRGRAESAGSFHDVPDPWLDEIMDDCFDVYRVTVAAGFANHAGDAATARRLIDRALRLAPDNAPALYQSGLFAQARQDYARAGRDFEACTRAAPDFADGWLRLIHVHRHLGNTAAAEATLATALRNCPGSPALQLERANRLAEKGSVKEAVEVLESAVRTSPNDANTWVRLASFHFQLERLDDGRAALLRALALVPEHPSALATLALHAIGQGDESGAREWLRRVREQPRVPREFTEELAAQYQRRFGRNP